MIRQIHLEPVFVDTIPETVEEGRLYISQRFKTALHRCCCGCGREVVTPLNPAKWKLTMDTGRATLFPSIGNWSFPCQSHYWIERNRVRWSAAMPAWRVAQVRRVDAKAAEALHRQPVAARTPPESEASWWGRLARWIKSRS